MEITGKIIDVFKREIYNGVIIFNEGIIESVEKTGGKSDLYIMPGLIDSHIHVESSMCTPGSFAGAAVSRGTVAVVSDPHEIANVLGPEGIRFMISDSEKVPLKFYFGAPSCVPATDFETNGSIIDHFAVEELRRSDEIKYLAEMMNFPGVVNNDPEVHRKINIAKKYGKPVDGHAPGVTGEMLRRYISAGISTDHECSSMEEALEKISLGMKILIREGSAARNLDDLKELYNKNPGMLMLCSDDLHPEMLMERHIDKLVSRLISDGYDLYDVLRSCTLNPALHYKLDTGMLLPGRPADFIIVSDYKEMNVLETWINGHKVFDRGSIMFDYMGAVPANNFNCSPVSPADIKIASQEKGKIRIIEAFDGSLFTKELLMEYNSIPDLNPDTNSDILKIVVKDRYSDSPPATAFIKGFGIKEGAFAGSVAHDSHNIISVGTNDADIIASINEIIRLRGGYAISVNERTHSMKLDIAGIMADQPLNRVADDYKRLSALVKMLGSRLSSPFMTLSFMALPVIPELKITDRGLFSISKFEHVPLFA